MAKDTRNLGLDIARSIAIVLVLVNHSNMFFKGGNNLEYLSLFGVLGVEIFFVLSGFLIGKIIINGIVETPTASALGTFYIRRWCRTLPLYFLVLVLVSVVTQKNIPNSNWVFLQNFNINALNFLAVSWSLSIEEWFYLLVPFILIVFIKMFDGRIEKRKIFFIVAIGIGLLALSLRAYTVLNHNPTWDYGVRKQIFLRLDSIMFGVVLAGIKKYHRVAYDKFTSRGHTALLSMFGFIVIGAVYVAILGSGTTFDKQTAWKIGFFSLVSIVCTFFIASTETSIAINGRLMKNKLSGIFRFISKTSYCVYLIHYTVFKMISTIMQGIPALILSLSITMAMAFLINRFYEMPIMNLRDKIRFGKKQIKETVPG